VSKPWLETWHVEIDDIVEERENHYVVVAREVDDPTGLFISAAPEMCRALLAVEWSVFFGKPGRPRCTNCGCSKQSDGGDGHDAECILDVALTKAGLSDQASRDAAREEIVI
jgi:hypothetical protein